jgi:hypothetical protein
LCTKRSSQGSFAASASCSASSPIARGVQVGPTTPNRPRPASVTRRPRFARFSVVWEKGAGATRLCPAGLVSRTDSSFKLAGFNGLLIFLFFRMES